MEAKARMMRLLAAAALIVSASGICLASDTWYVDNGHREMSGMTGRTAELAFGTIQQAVDAAASGDRILVAPGMYDSGVAYDETEAVADSDNDRDALAFVLWHAWDHLQRLTPTHPLAAHVRTLKSEMNAYKGVWEHELSKETSELSGLRGALSTAENQAALAALGLDKIAAALWAANDAADAAMTARDRERGSRDAEKAEGTTPELRKAVANLLVKAAKRVNAVYDFDPENAKAEQAIVNVHGIVEHYKAIASEAKHRKGGDEPEPEPEPTPEPEA